METVTEVVTAGELDRRIQLLSFVYKGQRVDCHYTNGEVTSARLISEHSGTWRMLDQEEKAELARLLKTLV